MVFIVFLPVLLMCFSPCCVRVKGFDAVHGRLNKLCPPSGTSNNTYNPVPNSTAFISLDSISDIITRHLNDSHHKVTVEAISALRFCIENFKDIFSSKLSSFLPELFQRLADSRPHIRDDANALLNTVRVKYDPNVVIAALSPRIVEVPDKIKTSVMQFLGVVAPHCVVFFSQPTNVNSFLGRISLVLGASGSKPSSSLLTASRRLLELVYKVNPQVRYALFSVVLMRCMLYNDVLFVCVQVILGQLSLLPLQQQLCLKKQLLATVPDVDQLVLTAGRVESRYS